MNQQDDKWLTKPAVRAIMPPRSNSAFEADVKAGRLPPYVQMGQVRYWLESEVKAHILALREQQMQDRAKGAE